MTAADLASYVSGVATVLAAIYTVRAYHWPKAPPVNSSAKKRGNGATPQPAAPVRSPLGLIAFALIAWSATAFDYIDRHYFWKQPEAESPLGPENARLDFVQSAAVWTEEAPKKLFFNVLIGNNGKSNAIGMTHNDARYIIEATLALDPDVIDATFIVLKNKLKSLKLNDSEINIGQADRYFSVPYNMPQELIDDQSYEKTKSGAQKAYFLFMMRYKDNTLSANKSIYTEKCVYTVGQVVHNCEVGHDKTYIDDSD